MIPSTSSSSSVTSVTLKICVHQEKKNRNMGCSERGLPGSRCDLGLAQPGLAWPGSYCGLALLVGLDVVL